jgi:hypothetical protein
MRKHICRKYSIRLTVFRKRLVEKVAGGGYVDEKAHLPKIFHKTYRLQEAAGREGSMGRVG